MQINCVAKCGGDGNSGGDGGKSTAAAAAQAANAARGVGANADDDRQVDGLTKMTSLTD